MMKWATLFLGLVVGGFIGYARGYRDSDDELRFKLRLVNSIVKTFPRVPQ